MNRVVCVYKCELCGDEYMAEPFDCEVDLGTCIEHGCIGPCGMSLHIKPMNNAPEIKCKMLTIHHCEDDHAGIARLVGFRRLEKSL